MARTRFEPARGIDENVAQRIMRPALDRALDRVETEARRFAPPAKVWITARDERVRPSHVYADGQEVPDNLRFKLPKTQPDLHRSRAEVARERPRGPHGEFLPTGGGAADVGAGFDLARAPRDPNLPIGQTINCRCEAVPIPEAIARDIHRTQAIASGTRVRGEVYCTYPRAAESEFGTTEDRGEHFMAHALAVVAVEMRGAR